MIYTFQLQATGSHTNCLDDVHFSNTWPVCMHHSGVITALYYVKMGIASTLSSHYTATSEAEGRVS